MEEGFKHILRVANTDLDGNKPIGRALMKIKGINFMFANAVCTISGVEKGKKTGNLTADDLKKIENVISNPLAAGTPSWMLNRRNDPEDGSDKHLLSSDLKFTVENDIKMMKKIKCYKGVRHSLGQPVRGQSTKSHFRKNKGKVMGVSKKKIAPAAPAKK